MLMQKKTKVKLQKTYNKILYLCEAYNETFVFLGMLGVRRDCLVHVNKRGKELYCHFFDKPTDTMAMMNQYQCVILQTRANCITIIDLKSYEFTRIPHYFMRQQSDQSTIYTFPQTKYLTILEYGSYNDNRLRLTYYNYPQHKPIRTENNPMAIIHRKEILEKDFESVADQWTYEYQVVKGNNHSMVLWYKARHDQTFELKMFRQDSGYQPMYRFREGKGGRVDLQDTNGWQYKEVKIEHNLGDVYQMGNRLNLALFQVFEYQPNKLMLFTFSNRQKPQGQTEPMPWSYTLDLLTNVLTPTPHDLGPYHDYQIDRQLFGSCHMIRTFRFQNQMPQPSPTFYFANHNLELIHTENWTCTHRTKYFFPGYDAQTMIESEYENGNVKEFTCIYKKLLELKEITLFFLLELYEDFDEDLLQEAVEMIV